MTTNDQSPPDLAFQDLLGDLPPAGILIHVPLHLVASHLFDSPFQYRRTYNEAKLDELTQNIRETGGIHQPLLARRRFPNVLRTQYEPENGIELAAGHRRKICGLRAEAATIPVLVKDLTDNQVLKIQITENLQREDVHPIEEAEGYQVLIDGGETADDLAKQFGKSRSYIYGRLKLLQACPEVRQACVRGEIGSEVALLVARLRTPKLQEKALTRIRGKNYDLKDGGSSSFRDIRELLVEHFTLDLKSPMFDAQDAMLLPAAGACSACPKRVGNAPEFSDLVGVRSGRWLSRKITGSPDVCTDPDCYEEKKKAHLRNEAAKLEQAGKQIVEGNAARAAIGADGTVKGAYISLAEAKKELAAVKKSGGAAKAPEVVTIQDPRTGKTVEAVKRTDLVAAGAKDVKPKYDAEAERQKREAEFAKAAAIARAEQQARMNVLRAVRAKIEVTERTSFDMTLIARATFRGVEYWDRELLAELWNVETDADDVGELIDTMTPDELMVFMFDCALIGNCLVRHGRGEKPEDLLKVAAYYGVDVAAARGDAPDPTPTPSSAARAATKAKAKGGKKTSASAGAAAEDFELESQAVEAGSAGEEAKDEPADAGVACERDPNTSDMFEEEQQ